MISRIRHQQARCSHCSETRYADPLASERISVVLEMEVPIRRSATGARRGSQADRRDGGEQSDLGRRTDRRRALVKDRHSNFPATVRRYMPTAPKQPKMTSQRWMTFVQNHAKAIIACDFFIAVTATFRLVYVFVIMEVGSRRILHFNATLQPTAAWTLQQFRVPVLGGLHHEYKLEKIAA